MNWSSCGHTTPSFTSSGCAARGLRHSRCPAQLGAQGQPDPACRNNKGRASRPRRFCGAAVRPHQVRGSCLCCVGGTKETGRRQQQAAPTVVGVLPRDVKPLVHAQLVDYVGHHDIVLSHQLQQHLHKQGAGTHGKRLKPSGRVVELCFSAQWCSPPPSAAAAPANRCRSKETDIEPSLLGGVGQSAQCTSSATSWASTCRAQKAVER